MTAAGARRGLGLPSYKQLLGRDWKREAAKADRRFAQRLDASEAKPKAAPAGAGRDVAGDFDRMFKVGDTVKGNGGKQTRSLKVAGTLSGGCPQLTDFGDGYGWKGTGRATYEVTTTERSGRWDVITSVVIDGSFQTRPTMNEDATASEYSSADFGEIAITRSQVAVDRKTGKRSKIGETERFTSTLDPFYKPEGSFDAFIAAQDDGEPAPPRPLRSSVWEDVAINFMAIPYDAVRSRVLAAEKLARTPNRCVTIDFPGAPTPPRARPVDEPDRRASPDRRRRRRHALLHPPVGEQHPRRSGSTTRGRRRSRSARWTSSGTASPGTRSPRPPQSWPDAKPVGLDFTLTSAAGIATAPVTFKAEEPTVYYEILDASIDNHTDASRSSSYCGEVGGSRSFAGTFDPEPFSADDHLTIEDGNVSGEVVGSVQAEWYDDYVYGCKSGRQSCSTQLPDRTPLPDGSWPVSVSFSEAADPSKVRLNWGMDDPEVGFVDAGDDECNSHVWGYFPQETQRTTVSRSELQGTAPITLTFAGSGHLDHDGHGDPASIDHTWEYKLTIRRVDENGEPIG